MPFFGQVYWLAGNVLVERGNAEKAKQSMLKTTDHRHRAVREVDRARPAVHEHDALGEHRVDAPRPQPEQGELDETVQGDVQCASFRSHPAERVSSVRKMVGRQR